MSSIRIVNKIKANPLLPFILLALLSVVVSILAEEQTSSINRFSRLKRRPQSQQQQQQPQSSTTQSPPLQSGAGNESLPEIRASAVNTNPVPASGNRTVRTADVFQSGEGYNIVVTNTCEREFMKVNIQTSRPFYGVIHTRNQRQKASCSLEGNGERDYELEIKHTLNPLDPNYCGVVRARRDSPEEKDTLSVVVAVRVHRNIELSDDKFFLLNCTNRCRKPDCSEPKLGELTNEESGERETINEGSANRTKETDECTIWKFPWLITLLWCLGILLLAMIISHCIMCSSLQCRCIRQEVEEREPSIYEGATDHEDDLYNKQNPYRIDYDNKDIYKTSNNYAPYSLDETQSKSRSHRQKHHKSSR